jgi:hypothetical protein
MCGFFESAYGVLDIPAVSRHNLAAKFHYPIGPDGEPKKIPSSPFWPE